MNGHGGELARGVSRPRERRMRAVYRRRRAVAMTVLLAVIVLIVVAASGGGTGSPGSAARASGPGPAGTQAGVSGARQASAYASPATLRRVQTLSLSQLAGQRIIYAYSGLQPPARLLAAVRAGQAAGVILFSDNVAGIRQVRAVVSALSRARAASPVRAPLLILTDQEGGQVRRLPGPPALSERQLAASPAALSAAAGAGTGAAGNLAAAGVNVNLAPVLDVARQRGNFIDEFARSYGPSSGLDGQLGAAFISAQQRRGVAATAKHFPGLGAATRGQDTDSRPVTLRLSLSALRGVDEAPYRAALSAGVKLVMSSWATYPALDPSLPAGLSARVLQGELRGHLGFRGVTISDTLSAGALSRFGTLAQRAVLAARAGADLLICSAVNGHDDPADGLSVLHALTAAIVHGQLGLSGARLAAARVLALRAGLAGG